MNSFRIFNRRAGSVFAVAALVITTAVPGLVSAATVTERSVEISSSTKSASNTTYNVKFKGVATSTGAFAVDFCTTAAIGAACTPPSGLSTSGVGTSGDDTVSTINSNTGVKVVLDTPTAAGVEVSVPLTGITNPSAAGVIYARVVTYVDDSAYTSNYVDQDTLGTYQDSGAVALTITDGFSVSGAVLESLVFCAAKDTDTINTGCTGTLNIPNVTLGTNGVLDTTPSEGTIKTQISTNAANGAAVWLKSSTAGGGLKRAEASSSDITPLSSGGPYATFPSNSAKFGLKLANLTGGTAAAGSYSASEYFLEYASNNATGVTSAYGSQIYNTGGDPISDGTANLTFAAATSNLTPAGSYSASLNLIATGKF